MNTSLPKNKIKLTLKAYYATRSPNKTVLEKLGMSNEADAELKQPTGETNKQYLKRKGSDKESSDGTPKKIFRDQVNKEKSLLPTEQVSKVIQSENPKVRGNEKDKKKKTSEKSRKEELMKQLQAVEGAIAKKRIKLEEK